MRLNIPIQLRWSDLDAYGHVNNVAILRLLEEARIQALWVTDDTDGAAAAATEGPPTAVLDNGLQDSASLSLIARQEIEYLASIPYHRQPVDVQLWAARIGGASLELCYEVWTPTGTEPATLYARAATTLVLVDASSGQPRRITQRERAAWSPYSEEPIAFRRR